MKMLSKAILAALVAVMIGGTIAYASGGHSVSPSPAMTAKSVSPSPGMAKDVQGLCDEAEHAGDARCNGVQAQEDNRRAEDRNDDRNGIQEQEGPDDSGHHSSNSGPRSDDQGSSGRDHQEGD
ncbi:MAG: hypothetical protein QOG21_619 [Actinomycetota bacterium]|jgi:hypothetical protein|nr:hypothetical protein [Actinomycetota bacterium]